jgi:choline-glycine betaine transporter
MNQGLAVVLGMSIAYFFSLLGMLLAYFSYRKKQKGKKEK